VELLTTWVANTYDKKTMFFEQLCRKYEDNKEVELETEKGRKHHRKKT